jgi:hypothetical protein
MGVLRYGLGLGLVLGACGGEMRVPGGGTEIHVTAPSGATTCGGVATLQVTVHEFELEAPEGQPHQEGHGHYHVYLHGTGDPVFAGAGATADVPVAVGLDPGPHEYHVVLMNNDHTEVEGVDHAVLNVEVGSGACVGASMASTTLIRDQAAAITVEVNNFTLEAPAGQANAAGHGHYHIYLDGTGDPLLASHEATAEVTIPAATSPGAHELHVVLMNNDHTEAAGVPHGVLAIDVQ